MPPARPQRNPERKCTNRAASVPVGQCENSGLESILRSKRQKDMPPVDLPARGRKRDSSSCVTSQTRSMASNSPSLAGQTPDVSEQPPRKRHKRSSSTPPVPRNQLSTQLQSRKRSRSRLGSPITDVEYVPPSRGVARLLRRTHSVMVNRSPDIYTHLAGPDGAENLLSQPPPGSVMSSTPNGTAGSQRPQSQSIKRLRGRPRKISDLTDESTKKDLIEEWARMRQSQGTLSLSGVNQSVRFSQDLLHETRNGDDAISPRQPETMAQTTSSDIDTVSPTTTTSISQSQQTTLGCTLVQTDTENALHAGTDPSRDKPDHDSALPPLDGKTKRPVILNLGTESPSAPTIESHTDQDTLTAKLAGGPEVVRHTDLSQCPGFSLPSLSSSFEENSVHIGHANLTNLPVEEQTEAASLSDLPKHGHSVAFSQTFPPGTDDTEIDSDEEFYMLDIPEVFSLPWVPVSSHLYVPPSIGKLVSGMREQLMIEARSRRRAEELYQAELSRRVSAEKTIEDLRIKMERIQQDTFGGPLAGC